MSTSYLEFLPIYLHLVHRVKGKYGPSSPQMARSGLGVNYRPKTYWVTVPADYGWISLTIDGRRLVSLFFVDKNGHMQIKAAGFHTGDSKWVGEQQNLFAIRVEQIPGENRSKLLPKIHNALGADLKNAEILFLDANP
jgi:hypothetical protein